MSDVKFMNVWRSTETGHQWTDGPGALFERADCDRISANMEAQPEYGIRRVGVLRVRMKPGFEKGAVA